MRRSLYRSALVALACIASTAAPVAAQAAATPSVTLSRDLLPAAMLADRIGDAAPGLARQVGVSIRGRDAAGLRQLEQAQYDASSPSYRRFLTPAQYADRFGADPADTAAVRDWLEGNGLHISFGNRAGTYVVAEGTVAQLQAAFQTTFANYQYDGRRFVANETPPTVPAAVTAVAGHDDYSTRATTHAMRPSDFPIAAESTPQDLWSVYEQPADNRGAGEQLAAFGWGAYDGVEADLRQYEQTYLLPQMPFRAVQVGNKGTTTDAMLEWDLDSQAASGMAPDAAGMTFYFVESGNVVLIAAAVQQWADDPAGAKQASGSYGLCDVFGQLGTFDAHEAALTQAVVEGRSFFASTGDNGSGCSAAVNTNGITIGPIPSQEYPATSPHSVAVGGTVLYTTGAGPQRDQEIAWTHGGGGPSYTYERPSWQPAPTVGVDTRAVSDVAAQSGDLLSGYRVISGGSAMTVAGTSVSAPLWQGMWTRINAAGPLGTDGVANLGYASPLIYANNASATKYAATFFDVTTGANGLYAAGAGWDYPTGWGVPRVAALARSMSGTTTPTAPTAAPQWVTAGATPTSSPSPVPTETPTTTPTTTPTASPAPTSDATPAPAATAAPTQGATTEPGGSSGSATPAPQATSNPPSPEAQPSTSPGAVATAAAAPLVLSVAPAVVTPGVPSVVTVHGRPGQAIELLGYSQPSTQYAVVRRATTDRDGTASFQVTPGTNTRLYARYSDGQDNGTQSASQFVQVKAALSLSVYREGALQYRFQGRNLPRLGGQLITLYRIEGGREIRTATTRTDTSGIWRISRTFSGSGRFTFVARSGQTLSNAPGRSNERMTVVS